MCSINLKQSNDIAILMVSFPLQGHLNQLLHLSRLIAAYPAATVHFVGTANHNRQAKQRFHSPNHQPISDKIIFHDFSLQLPCNINHQSMSPDPNAPIKFPSHLQPLIHASSQLRHPVSKLMRDLSVTNRRVIIVCDSMMGSVIQDFVSVPNAEMYTFHSVSAFTIFLFLWEKMGKPFSVDEEIVENMPSMERCFTPEFVRFMRNQHEYLKLSSGRIYNTCRLIESRFLELLEKPEISGNKKQWALGPFNPVNPGSYSSNSCHNCLKWLDRQGRDSVIFVSFGTTTSLSDEQIKEVAIGLEKSGQKFIWVLRDADRGDEFGSEDDHKVIRKVELLKEFEDRVENRGLVLRDWAPQLEILGHFATGGFMSHCGWNSCMESISMGVPIAAWPMHSDQPRNAVLMTKLLRIGVVVKDWGCKDEIVESSTVENVVRRLMASGEGEDVRRRAAEMGGVVRRAMAEGGVTRGEFDSFISHITR